MKPQMLAQRPGLRGGDRRDPAGRWRRRGRHEGAGTGWESETARRGKAKPNERAARRRPPCPMALRSGSACTPVRSAPGLAPTQPVCPDPLGDPLPSGSVALRCPSPLLLVERTRDSRSPAPLCSHGLRGLGVARTWVPEPPGRVGASQGGRRQRFYSVQEGAGPGDGGWQGRGQGAGLKVPRPCADASGGQPGGEAVGNIRVPET